MARLKSIIDEALERTKERDAALEEVARLRGNWAALRALVKTMIKDLRGIEDAHGYKDALQTVLKTMTGIARRVREEVE